MSLLPFHFFFSLDSPLLPQAAAAQARPAPGRRPAGAPCRRRLGPVVVVLILVVGALFLILGPTGSSSFTMPRIRTEFNEPVHVAVAAPPPPPTQMQAGVNTSGEEDSGLLPTTSASALTARSSCSTSSRRRASPPGSTPDPSPSAARSQAPSFLMAFREKPPKGKGTGGGGGGSILQWRATTNG
ncbi:hypothetical protein OsI_33045 [Oryza sativa Indica Group]|uniref:Uncharacterized protein n=1 Tax=Oryza sativa subsp. indica TaxID=39946 RepID=A2Z5X1_ORYSI|nr:hypothetical protein OsI_33045 [Oryza sativa Indica Group]